MIPTILIVGASLLFLSILTLGLFVILEVRQRRDETAMYLRGLERLSGTIEFLASENLKVSDRVLAAANSTAFQIVKQTENGTSTAKKLNDRRQVWNNV